MRFVTRSLLILLALYGLVFAFVDGYLVHEGVPLWGALAFPIVFLGIQYLIGPWIIEHVLDIVWDEDYAQLPARNREFLEKLCADRGLRLPRIGVISSGTPNAFSFGRIPSDSRIVVTTGLVDVLTPEEVNAVLAHELGHIEHWDFVVMTLAALAPLLLYQIYVFTRNVNNARAVAYGAYFCYWISQFVVLLLNRTREYFADHYAAEVTRTPNVLSSALIKIAYGMVRAEGEFQRIQRYGSKDEKSDSRRAQRLGGSMAVIGISNFRSGAALALASADPSSAAAVMRWDLLSPWARIYELNSTHPLTALRVRELNRSSAELHQPTEYPLPEERDVAWGRFPVEFVLWGAPLLCIIALMTVRWIPEWLTFLGIEVPPSASPMLLGFAGAIWIVRTMYRYRGSFRDATIGRLLEEVDVSQMRPIAVRLSGEIVGRGVPGAFWSPDMVLRDETGILFVLYRQSIPLARFMFAISEAETLIGQKVTVEGWFRRGLSPYLELSCLRGEDGVKHRAYSRWVQYGVAILAVVGAYAWLTA